MAIFVPQKNIDSNLSLGQLINNINNEYINPEIERRNIKSFGSAGIELFNNGTHKVYLNDEIHVTIE